MAETETIAAAVEPVLGALDLELYDLEVSGAGRGRRLVRVTVDRPDGVDLDAIAAASDAVSRALDTAPPAAGLGGPYTLEVTSPGLERRLRTPAHFRGALGSVVSVKPTGGGLRRRGRLVEAGDDGIDVEFDGEREHVPYSSLAQVRTVFEWGPEARPDREVARR